MKVTRLYTGDDAKSHYEDIELPFTHAKVIGLRVEETSPEFFRDWHTTSHPKRLNIFLRGALEIEASGGEKRRFGLGDVIVAEDHTGQGHLSRAIDNQSRVSMIVTLDETSAADLRSALTAVNAHFMAAFRQGDAAALAATYTSNGQALPPNSELITGRAAIQAFWHDALNMGIKAVHLETVECEAHGDTVIEVGTYALEGGAGQTLDAGKFVVIWKQEDGAWKWHRDIWNSSLSAQTP